MAELNLAGIFLITLIDFVLFFIIRKIIRSGKLMHLLFFCIGCIFAFILTPVTIMDFSKFGLSLPVSLDTGQKLQLIDAWLNGHQEMDEFPTLVKGIIYNRAQSLMLKTIIGGIIGICIASFFKYFNANSKTNITNSNSENKTENNLKRTIREKQTKEWDLNSFESNNRQIKNQPNKKRPLNFEEFE